MLIQIMAELTYIIEIEVDDEQTTNRQAIEIAQSKFNPLEAIIVDELWGVIPPIKIKGINYEKGK